MFVALKKTISRIAGWWLPGMALLIALQALPALAQSQSARNDERLSLQLRGGSSLTVVAAKEWMPVGSVLARALSETHNQFIALLGSLPQTDTTVRLMNEETFYQTTGAPRWTNALYFKSQIIIPLPTQGPMDIDNMSRSVRHEYTHAVIHALSGGRCPGWLDEGLAQWAEGGENPALRPALASYLRRSQPVPLNLLQGGFTKLNREMVAAAYAQSLIAAETVIQNYGFTVIKDYLHALRSGDDKEYAFKKTFGIGADTFEERLDSSLSTWAKGGRQNKNKKDALPAATGPETLVASANLDNLP